MLGALIKTNAAAFLSCPVCCCVQCDPEDAVTKAGGVWEVLARDLNMPLGKHKLIRSPPPAGDLLDNAAQNLWRRTHGKLQLDVLRSEALAAWRKEYLGVD